jgi:hypothetical protein
VLFLSLFRSERHQSGEKRAFRGLDPLIPGEKPLFIFRGVI